MRIAIHAPYGSSSEEVGLLYLLVKYAHKFGHEFVQLRCGGTFATCDRDADTHWKRDIATCFSCIQDQRELAQWAEITASDLSSNLAPNDLLETRKWVSFAHLDDLTTASYHDITPFPLVKGSFKNRFGIEVPNIGHKHHEQVVRRLLLSGVRASLAARRFFERYAPELILIVGGDDFISASVAAESKRKNIPQAVFKWDLHARQVKVSSPKRDQEFSCSLVLNGLPTMRTDIRTWPPEVLSIVEEITAFLDLQHGDAPVQAQKVQGS
jgi:hypothetical protein